MAAATGGHAQTRRQWHRTRHTSHETESQSKSGARLQVRGRWPIWSGLLPGLANTERKIGANASSAKRTLCETEVGASQSEPICSSRAHGPRVDCLKLPALGTGARVAHV